MNATVLDQSPAQAPSRRNAQKKTVSPVAKSKTVASFAEPSAAGHCVSDKTQAIVARVDVGWGNTLYIRGEGGCLSWDVGMPMICSGDDRWVWSCRAEQAPRQFKFLINDEIWSGGENLQMSGADITVCSPVFPG